ncbi:MAG: electron transfer flavoprotein subunit alpha/FixB family protein [Bacteroidetes bacterium]|nr:MAG: electron transfer flavoprotein subunit alpha/FixB family protein [Bacteroidota bacterium]
MSNNVIVIAEHFKGQLDDITFEMLGKAKELASALGGQAIAVLMGHGIKDLAGQMGAADKVVYVDDAALADFNPEAYSKTAAEVVKAQGAKVVMTGYTSMGLDVGPGLSVDLDIPMVAYVSEISGDAATSSLYGGKMNVESAVGDSCVISVLAGAFPAEAGKEGGAPDVEEASAPDLSGLKIKFTKLIEPEGGDVDITAQDILVSVGRGIQNEDNLPMMEELAGKLGGEVSCSRPIVDNKWLGKTRQVGKSGLKVKPKIYLAFGISGAPEHIEGMKDAELIIAVNTDENAPIFDYAHYGTTEDLFDLVPAITGKL